MSQVDIREAKAQFSRLLKRVQAGEEIIIAKRGKPYARLCPLATPPRREPGLLAGSVGDGAFEPLPEAELDAWEG